MRIKQVLPCNVDKKLAEYLPLGTPILYEFVPLPLTPLVPERTLSEGTGTIHLCGSNCPLEAGKGKKQAWGPVHGNPGCRERKLTCPSIS